MSSIPNHKQLSEPANRDNLDDDFAHWIHDLLDKHHILGASVAVVDNDKVESAGYGLARLPNVPFTPNTICRMASTSKAIGAAVMGLILEDDTKNTITVDGKEEKLTWSTPIVKILGEDFDLHDDHFNRNVTIEDALSNRSGVSGHDFNFGPWMGRDTRTYVRSLRHIDAVTTPMRTTFQYTNTMFAVIGHVIEKIDGKSFDEAARDRLWRPLGMKKTFATLSSLAASDGVDEGLLARGYYWVVDKDANDHTSPKDNDKTEKGHHVAEAHLDFDLVGPAAAVLSTANDYSKWIAALLQAVNPSLADQKAQENPGIISHKLFDELTTARTLVIPSAIPSIGNNLLKYPRINPQLYSLGWFTDPWMYTGQTILHHPGGCQGFGSHVFLLPEHRFGLVVIENGGGADSKIAQLVGREIIGRKLGISQHERRGEGTMAITTVTEQDPRKTEVFGEKEPVASRSPRRAFPDDFDTTLIPGTYEHKAYGRIKISLAPSATLQTQTPTIDGVRLIRSSSKPTQHEAIDADADTDADTKRDPPTYHITFLGRRSFLASLLLHPSPSPSTQQSNPNTTFFTLENLWPHGDLQSDPIPNLPQGHGMVDDSRYPFMQEAVYESQGFMNWGACFEVGDGKGSGEDVRLGMVLGRTESSEFRGRMGRNRDGDGEGPVEGWRGKMVWFERVE